MVCVKHPFSEWCAKPELADAVRERWPQMRVVYLPSYDTLPQELPDTHIFVGASLRAEQFVHEIPRDRRNGVELGNPGTPPLFFLRAANKGLRDLRAKRVKKESGDTGQDWHSSEREENVAGAKSGPVHVGFCSSRDSSVPRFNWSSRKRQPPQFRPAKCPSSASGRGGSRAF